MIRDTIKKFECYDPVGIGLGNFSHNQRRRDHNQIAENKSRIR